jgi:sialate O-acetylesterase
LWLHLMSGRTTNSPIFTLPGREFHFKYDVGLKTTDGGPLKGFAIAGEDGRFVWADAHVEGDTVTASSPTILKPVAVRFGWANNPVANLYNSAGLPASPFRTDDWPGVTAARP